MPSDTPLHKACNNGELNKIKGLVEDDGIDVNVVGASERRPIHRAAGANHTDVVAYLISQGADVNIQDKQGRTALHWAAISGHVEAAQILFTNGADSLVTNSSAEMPIHCAAESNRPLFVKALLDAYPDKKDTMFAAKTEEQKTACELAVEAKYKDVVNVLKEAGDPAAASAACVIS